MLIVEFDNFKITEMYLIQQPKFDTPYSRPTYLELIMTKIFTTLNKIFVLFCI